MAFLQVYFNGELKFTVPLQSITTTIGRYPDNDVVINNRGVSGHHATIVREGDAFYITDNNSTNGVFLNDQCISQGLLCYGDEITIFKHQLKFVAVDISNETNDTSTLRQNAIVEDQTVFVNNAPLNALLQKPAIKPPYLVRTGGINHGQRWLLSKQTFNIGKSHACDLNTGGWFAPKLSAVISCQNDGYYLLPEKRGKVRLNNKPISERIKLHHHDNLQIRGIDLTFYQPTT